MINAIKYALSGYGGSWKEKKGIHEFSTVIAERKAFLSTKKLTYTARISVEENQRVVRFSEMLIEAGSGLSSGSMDEGISPGFGFKKETYNTMSGAREGTIEEQSNLFGKDFSYRFDYRAIRSQVEQVANSAGYGFAYQITPVR